LLERLGRQLQDTVGALGAVYRLGGDEFCVLISTRVADPHALFLEAREALSEQGGAFTVTAAAGAVEIPREAGDPTQALRLADQHMYREKATSRGGAAELITCVLHAALAQRHPDLGEQIIAAAGPSLARIGPLVRASHERWDGKGYPGRPGRRADPARGPHHHDLRLLRAMLDDRSYKDTMSVEDALAELRRCAGTQFDPQLVEVFCQLVGERAAPDWLRSSSAG
jgi:hypothetical protein